MLSEHGARLGEMEKTLPPLTLTDLKLHPAFLSRLLFIGGEGLRLYDCAEELTTEFEVDLHALKSSLQSIVLILLRLNILELYLAQKQFQTNPTWSLISANKWDDIIFDPISWQPEITAGTHYEIKLTELGIKIYNELHAAGRPPKN